MDISCTALKQTESVNQDSEEHILTITTKIPLWVIVISLMMTPAGQNLVGTKK